MTHVNVRALADAIPTGGMPLWELASRVGVGTHELIYVASLEHLPLGVLIRMAAVLGVPIAKLFGSASKGDEAVDRTDTALIGACIGSRREGVSREALARALGWNLVRVEAGLHHLDQALTELGLRVGSEDDKVVVVGTPGRLAFETRVALARSGPGDGRVDEDLASAVWPAAFLGDTSMRTRPHAGDADAYRRHLVIYDGRHMYASEPVAFSLMMRETGR